MLDELLPDALGCVGPWDTPEVLLAENQCVSPQALAVGSAEKLWVLPLEMAELPLDKTGVSSIVMTGALVDMLRVSAELEGASVQRSWVVTHQIT